ncbi:toxin [Solibacillus sp. FSL W8-0372]|uniref:toxin n=1 Tax=Solibacillus sp. FSL W8-0372 TaxID=2921713 RepID=UPI0030D3A752
MKIPKAIDKIVDSNVGEVVKKSDVDEVVGKPRGEDVERRKKADILAQNRAKGRAFEEAQLLEFEKTADYIVEQVTIKTNQGTKIRVDAIGTDKSTGNIVIQEYKSSTTAPLTKNQVKGFPELQSGGGNVVGKGNFKGGTPILECQH